MELAKSFEPREIEARWYLRWEKQGYFRASLDPARPAYSILLPPPNVTGTLHMGHAFQQTLMDALIRYHRMRGDNTLWQVGTAAVAAAALAAPSSAAMRRASSSISGVTRSRTI